MPRALYLHPQALPSTPLGAATLLLLRDLDGGGIEVLMTRRSEQASSFPGAYVFPGGRYEPADRQWHEQVPRRANQPLDSLIGALAALRETFEELGILLARHADGRPVDAATLAQIDRQAPLWPQLQAHGLQPDTDRLWFLGRFTGDRSQPKRFATPFYVAAMPEGQQPVADNCEQFEPQWVRPAQALERHAQGEFAMIFPTIRTLSRLQAYGSVATVLQALAPEQPLWDHAPRSGLRQGKPVRFTEDEAPYAELELVSGNGLHSHRLDWQSAEAVPLRRNLQRLTAPNAGTMTGPGTNSYLLGEPDTGFIAVDPGPADLDHVQRLWAAAGGDIRFIVCTHSHADHAPGAVLLQRWLLDQGLPAPEIYGLPSAATARPASYFVPDQRLPDGALLQLRDARGEVQLSLRAIHTPGHAANHLCLLMEEDGLLLSGDHILQGSTTVIDTPDGSMNDYLASLDKLEAICAQQGVEFLLPAHGYALNQPLAVIDRLRRHRLAREARVLAAMRALPEGQPRDWVALAYADTPQSLWAIAERSLVAHVERIRALGLAHAFD